MQALKKSVQLELNGLTLARKVEKPILHRKRSIVLYPEEIETLKAKTGLLTRVSFYFRPFPCQEI